MFIKKFPFSGAPGAPVLRKAGCASLSRNLTAGISAASLCLITWGIARGATYSWDPGQTPATPSGGAGTWNTTSNSWSDGTADNAWTTNTITGDTAVFGGTAGTVTLGTAINALGLQFTTTGYTIALGGNTLTLGTGGINASALTSGTTTINGSGTLAVGADQTWTVGTGAGLSIASALSLGSSTTLAKAGSGALTLSSSLSGSGALTIGAGATNLQTTGANNSGYGLYNAFTGTINVGGTLGFNSPGSSNGADYYYNLSNAAVTFTSGGVTQWNSANGSTANNPGVAYVNLGSVSSASGVGTLGGAVGGTGNTKGVRYIVGTLNTDTTFGGVIAAGSGQLGDALTKVGTGTLTLTGANTYTGIAFGTFSVPATTIRGGTLQVGDGTSGSLASTGALTFLDTGKFNYQGQTAGSSQALGALTFGQGAGTVQSTYGTSGNTSLTFSNVVARSTGATANFAVSGGANGSTNKIVFTQIAGATPATGTLLDKGYFFGGDSYAAYDAGGFVRAYGSGDANYVTASGSNSIVNTSTGNVALMGNVDTQASAAVNTLNMGASTLALDTGAAFQTNGILVSGNSASTISGGASLAAATSGAELVIRVNGASDALNISTPIIANGANALTKSGAGALTLSATGNAYSGTTYVDEGTLVIAGSNTGNGAYNVNNSGTLTVTGTLTSTGAMTVANGSGNGIVNVNSGGTVTVGSLSISSSGTGYDTGSGVVNVNGGTLTSTGDVTVGLGGAQTGRLIINSGTVNVATTAEKWLKVGQFDTVNGEIDLNGGTLNLNTNSDIRFNTSGGGGINVINQNGGNVVSYSDNGTTLGGSTVLDMQNNAGTGTASNTYNLNGGTFAIAQVMSTATTGTRTFNFNGGTLQVASNVSASTFFNLGSGTGKARANVRNGGAILDTNGIDVTFAQALLHSNISGDNATDGGLTKRGAGTLTLSGASTYTGATTINAGTLKVTGSLGNSAVAVNGGATLAGTGTIGGVVTLAGGSTSAAQGTLAQGEGTIGTFTLGGLTLGGSAGNYSLLTLDANASTSDLLSITGALTLNDGGARISINNLGVIAGQTYTLLSFSSGLGTGFATGSGTTVGSLTLTNPSITFGVSASLLVTGTQVQLVTTGAAAPTTAYWSGSFGSQWTDGSTYSNFTTNAAGTTFVGANPSTTTDVIFAGTGATNLANTLGQDFSIKSLTFAGTTTGAADISGSNSLTVGTGGIAVESGNGGATLEMAGLVLNGAQKWANASSNDLVVSAPVSGAGGLTFNDGTHAGRIVLSGANTYTGGNTLNAGTLQLSGSGTLGSATNALTLNGGTFDLNNTTQAVGSLNGAAGATITNTGGGISTLTIGSGTASSDSGVYAGVISDGTGVVGLTKTGSGTIELSGANTYSGNTAINGGILKVSSSTNLGSTSNSISFNGGTLEVTSGGFDIARSILMTGAGTIQTDAGTVTESGSITGTGALSKSGAGTLVLSGTNTYTGSTLINTGTISVTGGTLGSLNADIQISPTSTGTGVLDISGGAVNAQRIILGGNSANNGTPGAGTVLISGGTVNVKQWLTVGSGVNGVNTGASGVLTMTGGTLNVSTTGTENFEVANFTGTTGTVTVSGSSVINIENNARIALGANNNAGNGTFTQSGGTITFYSDGGTTAGGTGGVYLGNAGTLTGTYTYNLDGGTLNTPRVARTANGATTVFNFNGGTLKASIANTSFMTGLTTAAVRNGGAIIDTNGVDVTIGQTLTHSSNGSDNAIDGGLIKLGAGALTLTAANTYTGSTTISAGTLVAGNASAFSSGAVAIGGGNLQTSVANVGVGSVTFTSGGLTINTGGVGTLTLAAGATFTMSGGTWNLDATSLDSIVGDATGSFSITGGTLALSNVTDYSASYTILGGFGSGAVSGLTITGYDTTGYTATLGNNGVLTFAAVPEPSICVLLGMGLASALIFGRSRRRASHS